MRYKAHRDGVKLKPEWETFEGWFDEVGPKPGRRYQFCRNHPDEDWNENNATWRKMPCGRERKYRNYYVQSMRNQGELD